VFGVVRALRSEAEAAGLATGFPFDPTARLLAAIAAGARGEVALAIQQVSELMAVPGVDIAGPLPAEANEALAVTAARVTGGDAAAEGFIAWLADALTPEVLRAGGLAPG
jgi:molybdate transport system substrate-binding protein